MRLILSCCITFGLATMLQAQPPAGGLDPQLTTQLGEMIERDWKERPAWAEMAVSILKGGPMGSGLGWFTGAERRHDWNWLAKTVGEPASDGRIEPKDLPALSEDDFDRIDRDGDGVITEADLSFAKNPFMEDESPAGDIFSMLDDDSNGRLTKEELQRWFDRESDGTDFLSVDDLKVALGYLPEPPPRADESGDERSGPPFDPRWRMMQLLLNGEMGTFTEGPSLDEEAPELDLPLVAKQESGGLELTERFVKLSDSRGKRPVVLIFGSFT